jgi:antitoxin HigA-1
MALVPTHRSPVRPGEVLVEEFLEPLEITQVGLAQHLGVTFQTVNAIVNGRRSITPNTALRLARVFGTSPTFWLNLQLTWDLYREMHSEEAASIAKLKPIAATT